MCSCWESNPGLRSFFFSHNYPAVLTTRAYTISRGPRYWCKICGTKPGSDEDILGIEGAFFAVIGGCTVVLKEGTTGHTHTHTLTPQGYLDPTRNGLSLQAP